MRSKLLQQKEAEIFQSSSGRGRRAEWEKRIAFPQQMTVTSSNEVPKIFCKTGFSLDRPSSTKSLKRKSSIEFLFLDYLNLIRWALKIDSFHYRISYKISKINWLSCLKCASEAADFSFKFSKQLIHLLVNYVINSLLDSIFDVGKCAKLHVNQGNNFSCNHKISNIKCMHVCIVVKSDGIFASLLFLRQKEKHFLEDESLIHLTNLIPSFNQ